MKVAALRIGGEARQWRELGFDVDDLGVALLGAIRLEISAEAESGAIGSWALDGGSAPESIDGLTTTSGARGSETASHPNGALRVDHVVVLTPSLERTTAALAETGVECRRVREAGGGARQGFFLVGDLLVEVVDPGTGIAEDAPARFWGLTVEVRDIDQAASLMGEKLGAVKDAVQPGRRIATVRAEGSGGLPLALITQRVRGSD